MAQRFDTLSDKLVSFISRQQLFFVATAAAHGRVNVSPKGMDSLRVVTNRRIVWLNLTGSGNETEAHVQETPRMTLMFCSFDKEPLILRVYGQARAVHPAAPEWQALYGLFDPIPGARQIFDLTIDLVQTSCGFGVPLFDYRGERELLRRWAENKGVDDLQRYWREKNRESIDGKIIDFLSEES
jgi:hypothetical protein